MYKITYPRERYDEADLSKSDILKLILKHQSTTASKMRTNKDYYLGRHEILKNTRQEGAPNTKAVCNHAKDIADTSSSYFMGNPITYKNTGEQDIEPLLDAFDNAEIDDADSDNALDMAIYGVAYEYIFAKEDTTELAVKSLCPRNTFCVYDDTIEQKPLFFVYYYYKRDDTADKKFYIATVLTASYKYVLNIENNLRIAQEVTEEPEPHYMGEIPVIEYQNNKDCFGDYEQQISLIDAYNTLTSDRVNDKKQFIDAILVIYGAQLGDNEEEARAAKRELMDSRVLEFPDAAAKAEYLIRSLDETGVEVLRKALKEDIYTFSHVPNLTDENFVGNSSGVAMEYKLLGLEMLTKTKTRYYKKGIRKRIRIFCFYLGLRSIAVEANAIVPNFSRTLPKNLLELSQMISNLKGNASLRTLLGLLPFVEDPDKELEDLELELTEALKRQQKVFGREPNTPPPGIEEEGLDA